MQNILTKNIFSHLLIVILTLLFLSPVHAAERQFNSIDLIDRAYRNGEITHSEALNYKVTAVLRNESLPLQYRSKGIIKSGTMVLMEARLNKHLLTPENEKILSRGRAATIAEQYGSGITLQSYASPQGHFRIHFTTDNTHGDAVPADDINGNGVPDYVERFATILDDVWKTEIEEMGYDAPPSDGTEGGDCLLDVYLADLDAYGYTIIDANDTSSMVYMLFENDFSLFFPPNTDPEGDVIGAMKVVAAHEFFHTIQFQVTDDTCTNGWWMEASSTWMEDYVYPEVNDYINYIGYWFQHPEIPLNTYNCTSNTDIFPYGTAIWIKHMTDKYGSEFVYDVWKKIKAGTPNVSALSAVIEALTDRGPALEDELRELRVANVTMTYDDALWYKTWQSVSGNSLSGPIEVSYTAINTDFNSSAAYANVSLSPLSAKYYSFSAPQITGNLYIDFDGGGNISVMVIGIKTSGGYDVTELLTNADNDGSVIISGFGASGPYRRVVVIPVNYSDTTTGSFNLSTFFSPAYSGVVSSIDIKPKTTSLVSGDDRIITKQQYYVTMKDDSNRQVLNNGILWSDNSQNINMNGNGLAVLTGTSAGSTISASFLTYTAASILYAASPAAMAPGTPRGCAVTYLAAKKSDSRCFIATAAFGSPLHPYVSILREFRDSYLLAYPSGRWVVSLYYSISPPIAQIISENPGLKVIVKLFLIPVIMISWALLKTSLSAKIVIAVLTLILISIIPVQRRFL